MSLFDPEPAEAPGTDISFRVFGDPEAWNIRPVPRYGKGKAIIGQSIVRGRDREHEKRMDAWQEKVAAAATVAMGGEPPLDGAVEVRATFYLDRPESVSPAQRSLPTVRPDTDKLLRIPLDALSEIVYTDDSRIVTLHGAKRYADAQEPPGVAIEVRVVGGLARAA